MVPNGWAKLKIDQLFERVCNPVSVDHLSMYKEIGIRSHGKGIFHKETIQGAELGNKRVFYVEPNCFVVNIVFAWELAVAKSTINEVGMIASHRFPMFKPKNNLCDVDYMLYFFKTELGKYLLELASPGGAGRNKTLGQSEFNRLEVVVPPVLEQAKIAKILMVWDDAINVVERMLVNTRQQKKSLTQILFSKKFRLDGFFDSWRDYTFSELIKIEIGGTPARDKPDYWDTKKQTKNAWLSIRDLKGNLITRTSEHISDLGVKNSNVKLFPKGTIVMSFKLTIGRKARLGIDCYTNEAICGFFVKDTSILLNDYLFYALEVVNFDAEIDQAIKGKTLNKAKLNNLNISVPSIEEQNKIVNILSVADAEIEVFEKKLSMLRLEKEALLQQLMTGKRRVKIN